MCNQGTCVNQDREHPGDPAYSCTCNEGYYIPSQSLACTEQCSADCNVGEYRLNCGGPSHSTSGGSCVSCTNLADGSYFSTSGGFTDTCTQTVCDTASCAVGEYLSGCTGSNAGTCVPCTGLSEGEYWTSNGGRTDSCAKSSCALDCGDDNYRQGWAVTRFVYVLCHRLWCWKLSTRMWISLRVRVRHVLRTADRVTLVLDVVILRKVRVRRATLLRVPRDNILKDVRIRGWNMYRVYQQAK